MGQDAHTALWLADSASDPSLSQALHKAWPLVDMLEEKVESGGPRHTCAQQCTGHLARGARHSHLLLYQNQKRSEGEVLGQQPGFHTRPTGGVHSEGPGTEALRIKAIWLLL